jgi:hypothetical protein
MGRSGLHNLSVRVRIYTGLRLTSNLVPERPKPELKVQHGRVDSAQANTEMLLFKDDGHILKDTVCHATQVVFASRYAFERDIGFNLLQAARGLELLRTSLSYQVAKHQIHFKTKLCSG